MRKPRRVIQQKHGEGFWNPEEYTILPYVRLRTLRECKDWLAANHHGWFDNPHEHLGNKYTTRIRLGRRIAPRLYFNGIRFEGPPMSTRKFRELVSSLIDKPGGV